jgi:transcriptional regulator with XRE-family HTH domain
VPTLTELDPAVSHRRLLTAFRTLRTKAGLTQEQVARQLGWSASKVARIENGKINISRDDLAVMLALYGVTNERAVQDLLHLAGQASQPSDVISAEFRVYVGLEAVASAIYEYEPVLIPGLLQTPQYARAVIRALSPAGDSDAVVEQRMEIRQERQRLLTAEHPPQLLFLIDESALRRQVGGRAVTVEQLERLKELHQLPNVTIQIVPFSVGEHVSMTGPFIILEFPDGDEPLLYLEDARHDVLTRDDPELARTCRDRFTEIAQLASPVARFDRIIENFVASHAH